MRKNATGRSERATELTASLLVLVDGGEEKQPQNQVGSGNHTAPNSHNDNSEHAQLTSSYNTTVNGNFVGSGVKNSTIIQGPVSNTYFFTSPKLPVE